MRKFFKRCCAREMFKKLGFEKLYRTNTQDIIYKKDEIHFRIEIVFPLDGGSGCVVFQTFSNFWDDSKRGSSNMYPTTVTKEMIKAIKKQIKELKMIGEW